MITLNLCYITFTTVYDVAIRTLKQQINIKIPTKIKAAVIQNSECIYAIGPMSYWGHDTKRKL